MDFQKYVDGFGAMTCVVSVENKGNGNYGKLRIVAGNEPYVSSIENPAPGVEMMTTTFTPNTEAIAKTTKKQSIYFTIFNIKILIFLNF